MTFVLRAFSAFALALVAAPADAAIALFAPDRDTSLFQEDGDVSNGAGPHGFVGRTAQGARRRMLLRFDVSSLPANAVVTRVELTLQMTRTIADAVPIEIHRLNADWGEAGSDSGTLGGTGAAAQAGDATWTQRVWPSTPWTTAGGDFVATASATQTVGPQGTYTFGSSAGLVGDVQAWLVGQAPNFGWILTASEIALPPSAKRFSTRENATVAERPQLLVEYETPVTFASSVPATDRTALAALALLALLAGLATLRRT